MNLREISATLPQPINTELLTAASSSGFTVKIHDFSKTFSHFAKSHDFSTPGKLHFGFCSHLLVAAIGAVRLEWAGPASLRVEGGIEADEVPGRCADER